MNLHIITPVKDSIGTTEDTLRALATADLPAQHSVTVWNDNSTPENTLRLQELCRQLNFRLVNISELTSHPSPNYLLVLQRSREEALSEDAALCIVESDVTIRPDTLAGLARVAEENPDAGIVASVTVDEEGVINYPYGFATKLPTGINDTRHHCSFCCSLLTPELLRRFDFNALNPEKNWYDVTISHESLAAGLRNLLCTNLPVTHRPHQSRPWKQLKYKNPLLYYWRKFTKGFDKI